MLKPIVNLPTLLSEKINEGCMFSLVKIKNEFAAHLIVVDAEGAVTSDIFYGLDSSPEDAIIDLEQKLIKASK